MPRSCLKQVFTAHYFCGEEPVHRDGAGEVGGIVPGMCSVEGRHMFLVNRQEWIEAMQLVKERLKKAQQTEDKVKLEATEKSSMPPTIPTSTKVGPA